jgi:hypothetical protein
MRLVDLRRTGSIATAAGMAMLLLAAPAWAAPTAPTWPENPQPIVQPAVVAAPPTWPASPQTLRRPTVTVQASSSGFDWGAAGIGAGSTAVIVAVTLGAIAMVLRHRKKPQSASFAP